MYLFWKIGKAAERKHHIGISALLKVIARGGLEPLSQNRNPVKKGGSAHRRASVSNLYPKVMLYIVKKLIAFRFMTYLHKIARYAIL